MRRMRACGCGECRIFPISMPGSERSSVYLPAPVVLAAASIIGIGLPMMEKSVMSVSSAKRPSPLRIDVKPRAPHSNETILFKKALSYRVVWKIYPVREAHSFEDYVERVLFIREHMLDAKPKLTRRCHRLGFDVFWMRFVKAACAVALDV